MSFITLLYVKVMFFSQGNASLDPSPRFPVFFFYIFQDTKACHIYVWVLAVCSITTHHVLTFARCMTRHTH